MTAIEIIRIIGTEFDDVSDTELEQWIEVVSPMVSKKKFGKLYNQAIAYLVCHKLKMAGQGSNPLGGSFENLAALGFSIRSISEAGNSISFGGATSSSSGSSAEAEMSMTSYGLQFLSLKRMVIVPILISGEDTF